MALERLKGRVAWIFADENFDVDQIVGIKNIKITNIEELARVAMHSYDPDFAKLVRPGDFLVGGENFGYGHPHYPPMKAMRHLGVAGVIAESFSPGFWRGEISMGFPLIPCPGILGQVERWDELLVDWTRSVVCHLKSDRELTIEPYALADRRMIERGGLIPYLKAAFAEEAAGKR
jgi:3-isopropylmalate/(R)-2-methylmalate dehydratase small subunit